MRKWPEGLICSGRQRKSRKRRYWWPIPPGVGLRRQRLDSFGGLPLVRRPSGSDEDPADIGAQCNANRDSVPSGGLMNDEPIEDNDLPAEIDFSKGVHGLHHIPSDARVLMPASIERTVWEYFSGKAEQRGVDLSELLTEVLKRDIEINEALK